LAAKIFIIGIIIFIVGSAACGVSPNVTGTNYLPEVYKVLAAR